MKEWVKFDLLTDFEPFPHSRSIFKMFQNFKKSQVLKLTGPNRTFSIVKKYF